MHTLTQAPRTMLTHGPPPSRLLPLSHLWKDWLLMTYLGRTSWLSVACFVSTQTMLTYAYVNLIRLQNPFQHPLYLCLNRLLTSQPTLHHQSLQLFDQCHCCPELAAAHAPCSPTCSAKNRQLPHRKGTVAARRCTSWVIAIQPPCNDSTRSSPR